MLMDSGRYSLLFPFFFLCTREVRSYRSDIVAASSLPPPFINHIFYMEGGSRVECLILEAGKDVVVLTVGH